MQLPCAKKRAPVGLLRESQGHSEESTSATVGRVAQGAKERGVDGRCGWQPAKPVQLCSHVNNKQEKRSVLASWPAPGAQAQSAVSWVPRYQDTWVHPGRCPLLGARALPITQLPDPEAKQPEPEPARAVSNGAPCRPGPKSQRVRTYSTYPFSNCTSFTNCTSKQTTTPGSTTSAHLPRP